MTQVVLPLKTVTPLFLGGAEMGEAAEMRPPAFRGALRYWLRALLAETNLNELQRKESDVFGQPRENNRGAASAVTVRLRFPDTGLPPEAIPYAKQPSQKDSQGRPKPTGRDYLYWSMGANARQHIKVDENIELLLNARLGAEQAQASLQAALDAAWVFIHLGGVGARSRRTAGSLSLTGTPALPPEVSFTVLTAMDAKGVADEMGKALNAIRTRFGQPATLTAPSAYDCLHPGTCAIWVLGQWRSSEDAVTAIGNAMRDFRNRNLDYPQLAAWFQGAHPVATVQSAAFGLPVPYQYGKGSIRAVVQGRLTPKERQIDRRSSPLWLHVTRLPNGQHIGVATLFKAEFLPSGEKLHAKVTRGGNRDKLPPPLPPPPDYRLIENWVANQFKTAHAVQL